MTKIAQTSVVLVLESYHTLPNKDSGISGLTCQWDQFYCGLLSLSWSVCRGFVDSWERSVRSPSDSPSLDDWCLWREPANPGRSGQTSALSTNLLHTEILETLLRTECLISSRVAEKESMSWWGNWDKKPIVSTYRTVMWLGNWPAWTVTSKVAKSWFLGWRPLSPVRDLIRVVFPAQIKKKKKTIITTVVYWKEALNLAHRPPHSPQLVYPNTETTGNSLCLRWARRRCRFLRSFSIAVRIFISRSFSNLCWTSNRVSPARTN